MTTTFGPVTARFTVVIVEDELSIAEGVAARFRAEGYTVAIAHDGPSGVLLVERLQPDLVILDLQLPGFDGLEVCRRIQKDRHIPVIMLTARDSETDLVIGLAVGADDYLTKPFSPRELVARSQALLRRVGASRQATPSSSDVPGNRPRLSHGDVCLDPNERSVRRNDAELHLTVTEFDLAYWLLAHPKTVFTREQLLQSVWGYPDSSGERTVDSHVQAVRKKLGGNFIRTVHGVGYGLGQAQYAAS